MYVSLSVPTFSSTKINVMINQLSHVSSLAQSSGYIVNGRRAMTALFRIKAIHFWRANAYVRFHYV